MRSSDVLTDEPTAATDDRFDMRALGPPVPGWRRFFQRVDLPVQLGRIAVLALILWAWGSGLIFGGIGFLGVEIVPEINDIFTAGPRGVWDFLTNVVTDDLFWDDLLVTLQEAVLGFAYGSSAGLIAGLLLGRFDRLAKVFGPFLIFANATPKIALAPILILWYGVDIGSKIALATIIVFFIVQIPTQAAVGLVDPDLDTVATAMGASHLQRFRMVILPGILPAVFGALRLAAIISILSVVFGEFLASKRGLGQRLLTASNQFDMEAAFGLMIVLAIIALILNGVIGLIERRLLRWRQSTQTQAAVASL